jgi:DNA-directed RNA polymerase specialized sigma24 family protein
MEMPYGEISKLRDLDVNTLKMRCSRAKVKLARKFKDKISERRRNS